MCRFILLIVSLFSFSAYASTYENSRYNYTVEIPENWTKTEKNQRSVEFISEAKDLKVKIMVFPFNKTLVEFMATNEKLYKLTHTTLLERGTWDFNSYHWATERTHYHGKHEQYENISFLIDQSGLIYWIFAEAPKFDTDHTNQVKELVKSFHFIKTKSHVQEGNYTRYTNPFKNYTISYPSHWKTIDVTKLALTDLCVGDPTNKTGFSITTLFQLEKVSLVQVGKILEESALATPGTHLLESGEIKRPGGVFKYVLYTPDHKGVILSYSTVHDRTQYHITFNTDYENLRKNRKIFESVIDSFQLIHR